MAVVTPTLPEIFEDAFERAGLEMRTGYDLTTARRSLNFLLLEWQNRGLNLFMIASGTETLVEGTASYAMPTDTIDLIEHSIRTGSGTSQVDQNLQRISVSDYAQLSNKNLRGKPNQIYIARTATAVTATLWPVPDGQDTYTLSYYRLVGADGLSTGEGTTASVPPRFVPALVSGLAYQLAMKRPQSAQRTIGLKAEYNEQWMLAAEEDQESASFYIAPHVGRI